MVMRTKIKEIIATGGKLGMRGDVFFSGGGVFFLVWLLLVCSVYLDSLVVVDYCTNSRWIGR